MNFILFLQIQIFLLRQDSSSLYTRYGLQNNFHAEKQLRNFLCFKWNVFLLHFIYTLFDVLSHFLQTAWESYRSLMNCDPIYPSYTCNLRLLRSSAFFYAQKWSPRACLVQIQLITEQFCYLHKDVLNCALWQHICVTFLILTVVSSCWCSVLTSLTDTVSLSPAILWLIHFKSL